MKIKRFDDLKRFVSTTKIGNFRVITHQFGTTSASVSSGIKQLQQNINNQLFELCLLKIKAQRGRKTIFTRYSLSSYIFDRRTTCSGKKNKQLATHDYLI